MNSKYYLILALFIFSYGCGLKKRPSPPKNTKLPSLVDGYTKEYKLKKKKKKEEKKKASKKE